MSRGGPGTVHVLLVAGSLREGSTNGAVLATAAELARPPMTVERYEGLDRLPHFNPDRDAPPLDPAVDELRSAVHRADALLFSTPEYAGALPGSFKNLLDWLIGDDHPRSLYEKPVAWINASAGTGAVDAHASLRTVLGYAHATVVDSACAAVPVPRGAVAGGRVTDAGLRADIAAVLAALASVGASADA